MPIDEVEPRLSQACDIWSLGVIMYILLCGYPPFFSTHGGAISAGMKTKIRAGEYQFPKDEWKDISPEAKSIIQKMLTVDAASRVTIDWILKCAWFTGTVPETPINIRSMLDPEIYEQMHVCFTTYLCSSREPFSSLCFSRLDRT